VGTFAQAGGSNATRVARWNGVNWSGMGSGIANVGSAVAATDKEVHVGGTFLIAGGKPSYYFGIWNPPSSVPIASISVSPNGDVAIEWTSQPNQFYRIHSSTDLATPFAPIGDPISSSATTTVFTNANGGTARFFVIEKTAP